MPPFCCGRTRTACNADPTHSRSYGGLANTTFPCGILGWRHCFSAKHHDRRPHGDESFFKRRISWLVAVPVRLPRIRLIFGFSHSSHHVTCMALPLPISDTRTVPRPTAAVALALLTDIPAWLVSKVVVLVRSGRRRRVQLPIWRMSRTGCAVRAALQTSLICHDWCGAVRCVAVQVGIYLLRLLSSLHICIEEDEVYRYKSGLVRVRFVLLLHLTHPLSGKSHLSDLVISFHLPSPFTGTQ